jgi:hypothetical protein
MQKELAADSVNVHILGVNEAGLESGNATICNGRDLPWLQDLADSANVWASWGVTFRDVVILDPQNQFLEAYNLTVHNLANGSDYATLKELLRATAKATDATP